MGMVIYYGGFFSCSPVKVRTVKMVNSTEPTALRWKVLEQIDEELMKGDERAALSLVKELQGKPGGLCCFGTARQIPPRLYTLDELKLNGIDASAILSPVDGTLGSIERYLQVAAVLGGVSAWALFGLTQQQILFISVGLLFLATLDSVTFSGGFSGLVIDTIGHAVSQKYRNRVVQHEAGHFLIAYLLGILPKGYTLTSLEALRKEGSLNVQAGTAFVDIEFREEVDSGKLSSKMLDRFSCIALAGVATEYLLYGYSEGGLSDIYQLDSLLKGLGFTQKKADSQVRWAVLNTILLLRRHERVRLKVAEAMSSRLTGTGFPINEVSAAILFFGIGPCGVLLDSLFGTICQKKSCARFVDLRLSEEILQGFAAGIDLFDSSTWFNRNQQLNSSPSSFCQVH